MIIRFMRGKIVLFLLFTSPTLGDFHELPRRSRLPLGLDPPEDGAIGGSWSGGTDHGGDAEFALSLTGLRALETLVALISAAEVRRELWFLVKNWTQLGPVKGAKTKKRARRGDTS